MNLLRFIFFTGFLALCSCSTTPFFGDLSSHAGKKQAQQDFAAGKAQIYLVGTIFSYEPGITDDQEALVAQLPRNSRFTGCDNPKARTAVGYAKAYNQEIVALLQNGHAH